MLDKIYNSLIFKKFLFLFIGIVLASFGAIPYVKELLSQLPQESIGIIPPDFILGIVLIIQLSIFTLLGLFITNKVNISTPVIDSIVEKKLDINLKSFITSSVLWGLLIGTVILIADFIFYKLGSSLSFFSTELPVWYKGLIGSFFGGIGEEIIYRLFFMSLLIWGLNLLIRYKGNSPKPVVVWMSMIIAAVLFALAHLPVTAAISTIVPIIVIRAILLNSIAGISFGYLFWKKGLIYTMITHFMADITLHVIAVLIFS